MASKKKTTAGAGNEELAAAMRELRQGSRTSRHKDRHAAARKGEGKGGRHAWKRDALSGIRGPCGARPVVTVPRRVGYVVGRCGANASRRVCTVGP